MASPDYAPELGVETLGEMPESMVATQVDAFLSAEESLLRSTEVYKQVYSKSQGLLLVEPEAISDPGLRQELARIQVIYKGNGGV